MKVKQNTKAAFSRLTLVLFAMVLMWFGFLAAFVKADAEDEVIVNVSTWNELSAALDDAHTSTIVITKALGQKKGTTTYYGKGVLYVVGNHTLDLNGHDIDVCWGDEEGGEDFGTQNIFALTSGSSLTIEDSSGDNSGMIRAHAYMTTAITHVIHTLSTWTKQSTGEFNVFYLYEGANLTINGGEIVAGRHKSQWLTNAHDEWETGMLTSYTGSANQVKEGSVIVAEQNTNIVINGGEFYNRANNQHYRAMFELQGSEGNITINGGTFQSITGSDIFYSRIQEGWNVQVNAGTFKCDYLNRVWPPALN